MRLTDMGVPTYLLKSVLRLVGAQRLLRTLCDHCAEPVFETDDDQHAALLRGLARLDPALGPPEHWVPCSSVGCARCNNTGFSGRQAVFEMLDEQAAHAVADGRGGHRTMEMEALGLFARGQTTLAELVRVFGATAFRT